MSSSVHPTFQPILEAIAPRPALVSDPKNPKIKRPVAEIAAEARAQYNRARHIQRIDAMAYPRPVEDDEPAEARIKELEAALREIEKDCAHRSPLDAGDLSNRLCDIAYIAQRALSKTGAV